MALSGIRGMFKGFWSGENDDYEDDRDGIEDDDQYEEDAEDDYKDEEEEYEAPPAKKFGINSYKNRKVVDFSKKPSESRSSSAKVRMIHISDIREAKEAANELINGAVLDVTFESDEKIKARLLHFMAGVTYAIGANLCKSKDGGYAFYPPEADVGGNRITDEFDDSDGIILE